VRTGEALRIVLSTLGTTGARRASLYSFLHLVERLVLVAAAFVITAEGGAAAIAVACVLAAMVAVRAAVRTSLMRDLQVELHRTAVDRLLDGDVVATSALADSDVEASVLEGVGYGVRLAGAVVPEILADALATLVILGLLLVMAPARWILVGMLALAMAGLGIVMAQRITRKEEGRAWESYRPVVDGLVATIGGRLEIVANGSADLFRRARQAELDDWSRSTFRSTWVGAMAQRIPAALAVIAIGAAVFLERSLQRELTTTVLTQAALGGAALPVLSALARNVLEVPRAVVRFAPLAMLVRQRPVVRVGQAAAGLPTDIEWQKVTVRYGASRMPALSQVSLTWRPRDVLVLRGANGSGKSTLLRTLVGVTPIEEGTLTLGRVALGDIDARLLREHIGYLPQRPFFPPRVTVRQALHMIVPGAPDASLKSALEQADVWGVLSNRARDTKSGPLDIDSSTLSVGERQRVAIARVLVRDRAVYLFDEPDANLDREGVRTFADIVRSLVARGRMVAIAAHTDEIVALGNMVVSLGEGRIVSKLPDRDQPTGFTPQPPPDSPEKQSAAG
jgi:ATP-binding cassette subfamily C protein CydD